MRAFTENAASLLEAAECAVRSGDTPSHLTILLGCEGGIRMIADSDWPLESIQAYHGATMAYRVIQASDTIRVEGRDGRRTCLFESPKPAQAARFILSGTAPSLAGLHYRALPTSA